MLARREVGSADAEDVLQDALLRARRRRATFRADRGTPRAWLAAVLLDRCRRHRVRRRPPAAPPAATTPREPTTLHYLLDLSVAETATVLGISAGSVTTHLHAARAALRDRLTGGE